MPHVPNPLLALALASSAVMGALVGGSLAGMIQVHHTPPTEDLSRCDAVVREMRLWPDDDWKNITRTQDGRWCVEAK